MFLNFFLLPKNGPFSTTADVTCNVIILKNVSFLSNAVCGKGILL